MSGKAEQYLIEQLAATGFAVMGSHNAFSLRPDLWATPFNCATDFNEMNRLCQFASAQPGVELYNLKFVGDSLATLLATRCRDELEKRIHWVTGLAVASIEPYESSAKVVPIASDPSDVDAPPDYPCAARSAYFHERGLTDPLERGTRFPPSRQAF